MGLVWFGSGLVGGEPKWTCQEGWLVGWGSLLDGGGSPPNVPHLALRAAHWYEFEQPNQHRRPGMALKPKHWQVQGKPAVRVNYGLLSRVFGFGFGGNNDNSCSHGAQCPVPSSHFPQRQVSANVTCGVSVQRRCGAAVKLPVVRLFAFRPNPSPCRLSSPRAAALRSTLYYITLHLHFSWCASSKRTMRGYQP